MPGTEDSTPQAEETSSSTGSVPLSERVPKVAQEAYYQRAFGRAETARGRAQTGFTMASFIAGAIATAGLAGGIMERPAVVQWLGFLAFAAWLVTGGLLLWAAIGEFRAERPEGLERQVHQGVPYVREQDFVNTTLMWERKELLAIYHRSNLAIAAAVVALVLTAGLGAANLLAG